MPGFSTSGTPTLQGSFRLSLGSVIRRQPVNHFSLILEM
jgi:hypothetical protein